MMRTLPILLAPALTAALMVPAYAAPALWKVGDEDSAIWLFGSIHMLPDGTDWRTPLFEETLAGADKVYFEADIGPEAQVALAAEGFARGVYTDGTLLTDKLERSDEKLLRKTMATMNMPMGGILAMRPWMAANTISVSAILNSGFGIEGVDMLMQAELPDERKGYLETGAEQLELLAGAPEDEQIEMLIATLEELGEVGTMMDEMLQSWTAGTPEDLTELFLTQLSGSEEQFIDRLIYDRNENWLVPIRRMLAENEAALVVVGTGHLVGEGGVPDLLERGGLTVERVQ